jgi:hypothetical protein
MKATKIVIQSAFSFIFVLFFCQQIVSSRELSPGEKRRIESGAIDTFETIISLWKREKFDEIYEYGDRISREQISKETFISRMKSSYRLASSWETVQDIKVEIVSPTRVHLKAEMGFAWPSDEWGDTVFGTLIFGMTLEDKDEWRIDLRNLYGSGSEGFRGWRGRRHGRP